MKNGRLLLSFSLLLAFGCVALAFIFFPSSSVNATLFSAATATQENLWAYANVAKSTYTATAMPLPTDTPTKIPPATEPPAALVMEIVNSAYLQSVQAQEQATISPPSVTTDGSKYILVDISEQHMYVYENDALIYSFVASTGIGNSTRIGTFAVQTKLPNAYGATWNIWMPNWLGIYYSGSLENGIHALPILSNGATLWEGFLGRPVSYGCVVLGTADSILLYDWAEMGTTVEIQR
jgi:lipoprotein-anchoring transpeptidase ErfK/SrfK